jgi:pyridoxal phosphate enzyme (YggS family)
VSELTYAPERAEELAEAHARIRAEIDEWAAETPRDLRPASGVELMTVTKFFPASDVAALYDAGVRVFGENRDQEASAKASALADYAAGDPPAWNYIGQLQSNKAKSVVKYATAVHSVDRSSLATALGKAYRSAVARYESEEGPEPASAANGGLECLIQVGLDDTGATPGEAARGARGGADPDDVWRIADHIAEADGLRVGGLMAVAPLGADPAQAFEKLWNLSVQLRRRHPEAWKISAGMSADMREAIRWGSTSVRVGSAIMGRRPSNT